MRTGRPTAELKLAAHEREALEGWVQRSKSAQALALRARVILRCAEDKSTTLLDASSRDSRRTGGIKQVCSPMFYQHTVHRSMFVTH